MQNLLATKVAASQAVIMICRLACFQIKVRVQVHLSLSAGVHYAGCDIKQKSSALLVRQQSILYPVNSHIASTLLYSGLASTCLTRKELALNITSIQEYNTTMYIKLLGLSLKQLVQRGRRQTQDGERSASTVAA